MKIAIQYVNDSQGNTRSIQLPVSEWEKVMTRMRKYEQMLKMKSALTEAYEQADAMRKSKEKKQTLSDFLHEL